MENIKVNLNKLVSGINLPTVIKTTIMPNDNKETIFIATQIGEIYYLKNDTLTLFLDIKKQIIKLGSNGGYDERGLLGLAFHPFFYENGLFYLHYSLAGTQGKGAQHSSFTPSMCDTETSNLKWINRIKKFDHIDTIEEWIYKSSGEARKLRTLLNIIRPFMNHNGVNSLNFSPQTGSLVFTNGDGGSGYDPYNLAQDDLEIAGKIIEIDVDKNKMVNNPIVATRFEEIDKSILDILYVIVKGVRNINGISYYWNNDYFIKYVGNVGQDVAESVFAFNKYQTIPVSELVNKKIKLNSIDFINLGWRAWGGPLPTSVIKKCSHNELMENNIAYFNETIDLATKHLLPLVSYYHQETRDNKVKATCLTGYKPYQGRDINKLTNHLVFSELMNVGTNKGALLYTKLTHFNKVSDLKLGSIYEIVSNE